MTAHPRPILRFVLKTFLLLPVFFALWWYFGALLAAPAVWLVDALMTAWLADAVQQITLQDSVMTLLSALGETDGVILPAAQAGNQLAFSADTRILSYSIPFYAALHFATPSEAAWERFLQGLLVLWLLLAIGLLATALRDLMLGLGGAFLSMPGVPPANLIALLYQFCTLIVPPLAPVLLWAYGARDVPAFRALLPAALVGAPDTDASSHRRHSFPSHRE